MVKAIVIDDEAPARNRIRRYLESYPGIDLIAEVGDGAEALKALLRYRPDLVFLDIQMPVMNGFELLERLDFLPNVIFISAYDEYALRAFEVNAVDYLLKPFSRDRLHRAVDRALDGLEKPGDWRNRMENLLEYVGRRKEYLERISYRTGHAFQILELAVVDFFRIEDGSLFLHSCGERKRVDFTLGRLESRLDPEVFMRVHRNAIANLGRIQRILPWGQGRISLDYSESGHLQVSRERTAELKTRLGFV